MDETKTVQLFKPRRQYDGMYDIDPRLLLDEAYVSMHRAQFQMSQPTSRAHSRKDKPLRQEQNTRPLSR